MSPDHVDRQSHSYLLGVAEAEIRHYREILSDLVSVVGDDLGKLPEGYRGRYAIDRAKAKLAQPAVNGETTPRSFVEAKKERDGGWPDEERCGK